MPNKTTSLQHLSEHIVGIAQEYFNPLLPLAIQTPNAWNNLPSDVPSYYFENDFFEMLNKKYVISYITLGNTKYVKNLRQIRLKCGSHILLLSTSNLNLVNDMLIRIVRNGRSPKARVVVAVLEPMQMSRKIHSIAGDILFSAWIMADLTDVLVIL